MTQSIAAGNRIRFSALGAATAAALVGGATGAVGAPGDEIHAFKPIADAFVSSARPGSNFGTARLLRVDGAPETTTYLRFRLRRFREEIESVTLLVRASTGTRAGFAVRPVSEDDWREQRLTYANAPSPSLRYAASQPVSSGGWSAVDITPFIGPDGGVVSLALTTRAARGLSFWSRESNRGPRLVVRLDGKDRKEDPTVDGVMERLAGN